MPSRHTDNQENQDPGQTEPPPEVSEHEQLQNALQTLKAMKRNKKEMKKAKHATDDQLAEQRRQLKEQAIELERLKADRAESEHPKGTPEGEGPSKKSKHSARDRGGIKTDALRVGKRLAICDLLWIEPMALSYLIVYRTDEVPDELAEMEAEGEDLDLEKAKQQAQVIYEKLPAHLREHVGTGWFRERFNEGMKAIRSQQIHNVADLFPGFIFPQINCGAFAQKSKRARIPEVAALLEDSRFLYDRDPKTPKDRREGHLRNPCILKILQCALYGPAVVKQGTMSTKTRQVNGALWGIKKTTIPMLAYAATAALFVLSGEGEFTERGVDHAFEQFYHNRIGILTKESKMRSNRVFRELMEYYDRELFPGDEGDDHKNLNPEEREILKAIDDAEDEEEPEAAGEREREAGEEISDCRGGEEPRMTSGEGRREFGEEIGNHGGEEGPRMAPGEGGRDCGEEIGNRGGGDKTGMAPGEGGREGGEENGNHGGGEKPGEGGREGGEDIGNAEN